MKESKAERAIREVIELSNENWEAAEREFALMLNEKNRLIFQAYDEDLRRVVVARAIQDGVFTSYKIVGHKP